ncbi:MAG: protease inhibitor I42 family protein [Candidatus Omnitrophota bacterium]
MKKNYLIGLLSIVMLGAILGLGFAEGADVEEYSDPTQVIRVPVGQEFVITLAANPTTGYTWDFAVKLDEKMFQLVRADYTPNTPQLTGSGGEQMWVFKAMQTGEAEISLKYWRPWEQDDPDQKQAVFNVEIY